MKKKKLEMILQPEFPKLKPQDSQRPESDIDIEVKSDPHSEEDTEDAAGPASEWTSNNGQI